MWVRADVAEGRRDVNRRSAWLDVHQADQADDGLPPLSAYTLAAVRGGAATSGPPTTKPLKSAVIVLSRGTARTAQRTGSGEGLTDDRVVAWRPQDRRGHDPPASDRLFTRIRCPSAVIVHRQRLPPWIVDEARQALLDDPMVHRAPGSQRWRPSTDDWNRLRPPTLGDFINACA